MDKKVNKQIEETYIQQQMNVLDEAKLDGLINKAIEGDTTVRGIVLNLILGTKSKKIIRGLLAPSSRNWNMLKKFELYLTFQEGIEFINIMMDEGLMAANQYLSNCFMKKYKNENYTLADTTNIVQMFTKEIQEIMDQ